MGIAKSRTIRLLKEKGLFYSLLYFCKKRSNKAIRISQRCYYQLLWCFYKEIPKNYHGILIYNGVTGGGALTKFFERSAGITTPNPWMNPHFKNMINYYASQYRTAKDETKGRIMVYGNPGFDCYTDKELAKFFALLNKKVPVVFLVRDPISRLKAYINHGADWWEHRSDVFTLMHDPSKIINRISYHGTRDEEQRKYPTTESIKEFFTRSDIFLYFSLTQKIPNASEIIYMDMSEINKEKIWQTMNTLSQKFSLPKPQLKDKPFFEQKIWDSTAKILPLTLFAHPKHIGKSYTTDCSILYYQVFYRDKILKEAGEGGIRLFITKDSTFNNKESQSVRYKDITQELLADTIKTDIYIYIYILYGLCNIAGQYRALYRLQNVYAEIYASFGRKGEVRISNSCV
ncbi:hypothetical protein CQA66_07045 [Helicobacter aurati]|uniref:Uncharacterized protein n=2 Tax=Helicobacter aurati TaxID=137778 RepID=A0A3D8J1G1_9HELI|nr:DUF2972 domain-containing protein [Helicobacter aurati]RDU71046.1 hypothetical protein CQA66_07045 [Helicobacter aurati]